MRSKLLLFSAVVVAGVLIVLVIRSIQKANLAADAKIAAHQFAVLTEEYDQLEEERGRALAAINDEADGNAFTDESLSDEEWLKRGPGANPNIPDPDSTVLPKFLELARQHAASQPAFDALFFVILRGGPGAGNAEGAPWQAKEEALDLIWYNFATDPRMVHVCELLGDSLPSQKSEEFLKRATASSSGRKLQAAATFHLARYYDTFGKSQKRSAKIASKSPRTNVERYWKVVISPYLAQFPFDRNKNADRIDGLLAKILADFADAPTQKWQMAEPTKYHVETVTPAEPKTFADLARPMLFAVNDITPGQKAPEIEGIDADGQTFRLSDYRGKVVLLTFSADWCSDCAPLYPIFRKLVEKYRDRPFVVLSVNRDDTLEDLRSSTDSGKTTWRSWWDGRTGPINSAWNDGGIPDVYLLDDEQIIQVVNFTRLSRQEDFEQAIEPLLSSVAALTKAEL